MSDIDVLIKPADLEAATSALHEIGYKSETHLPMPLQLARHASLFVNERTGFSVDLHSQIIQGGASYRLNDIVWEGSLLSDVDGQEEIHLCQTDLLFSVLAHGLFFAIIPTIRWIPDSLFAIGRNPAGVDWYRLSHLAEVTRLGPLMANQLNFLKSQFNATIPTSVIASLGNQQLGLADRFSYSITHSSSRFAIVNRAKKQYNQLLVGLQNLSDTQFRVRAEFIGWYLIHEFRKILRAVFGQLFL